MSPNTGKPTSFAKAIAGGTIKPACNRSQHKQSFTHYPNRHQSSDAQTAQHWVAEYKQHLLHEQFHAGALPH